MLNAFYNILKMKLIKTPELKDLLNDFVEEWQKTNGSSFEYE